MKKKNKKVYPFPVTGRTEFARFTEPETLGVIPESENAGDAADGFFRGIPDAPDNAPDTYDAD